MSGGGVVCLVWSGLVSVMRCAVRGVGCCLSIVLGVAWCDLVWSGVVWVGVVCGVWCGLV